MAKAALSSGLHRPSCVRCRPGRWPSLEGAGRRSDGAGRARRSNKVDQEAVFVAVCICTCAPARDHLPRLLGDGVQVWNGGRRPGAADQAGQPGQAKKASSRRGSANLTLFLTSFGLPFWPASGPPTSARPGVTDDRTARWPDQKWLSGPGGRSQLVQRMLSGCRAPRVAPLNIR